MDKRDLSRAVAKRSSLTARQVETVIDILGDSIIEGVKRDGEVKIPDFGTFWASNRYIPLLGKSIKLPLFRPVSELRGQINGVAYNTLYSSGKSGGTIMRPCNWRQQLAEGLPRHRKRYPLVK